MSETPDWFWQAIDTKPECFVVEVDDCDINYQRWGEEGKPGLLFVHGHNAHAHWWDFIAPSFLKDYQVAALDLSGMGESDHRDEYSVDLYAEEILTVADQAALSDQFTIVAHSFGGMMATRAARLKPDRIKGLVLVDSGLHRPGQERPRDVERWNKPKVYPDFDIARSRFRLQPPQTCENQYIVDYIARNSVERIDEGWVWKFDEELSSRMSHREDTRQDDFLKVSSNVALIYGELSKYFTKDSAEYMQELKPELAVVPIANAQHHLFLDQPLAFIDELKTILAGWQ